MLCDFSQIVCFIYLFMFSDCLLDSLHMHIWVMFTCSQSQKVLFRKLKFLFKFWSLLLGICDWAPSLEFIPSNIRQFSKTQASSEHSSVHLRSAAFTGYTQLVQGSLQVYKLDCCEKSGTWLYFGSLDGVIIIKDFHWSAFCLSEEILCLLVLLNASIF